LATPYYSQAPYAGLLRQGSEAALRQVPTIELAEFYARFREFENPGGEAAQAQPIGSVWKGSARTVAISPWFHLEPEVEIVTECTAPEVREAECLASSVDVLRELAALVLDRRLVPGKLRYGVIAFIGVGRPLMNARDRDRFWRAFQAPVFEQFRGFHGELLAWECERHHGLHVEPESASFERQEDELVMTSMGNLRYPVLRLTTGIAGVIEENGCGCGSTTPRLSRLRLVGNRPDAMMAVGKRVIT